MVLNCGGLSAAISALSQPEAQTESLKFVTKIFESVKQDHNQLIFITDNEIYQNEKHILLWKTVYYLFQYVILHS